MKKKMILLAVLAAALFLGCSNIFEDTIADKSSDAADQEELELALNARSYDKIIGALDGNPTATQAGNCTHLQGLSLREKYLLQMAYLGKSGFNAVDILSAFLETDSESTSDVLLKSLSAADKTATNDVLNKKQAFYKGVKAIRRISADKDVMTAAGIAATLDTLMSVTRVANKLAEIMGVTGEGVSFDPGDPNYIGKIFDSGNFLNETARKTAIESAINSSGIVLTDIHEDVDLLDDTIKVLVPAGQTDMTDKLNEYTEQFKTGNDVKASITEADLADFIMGQWKKE
jgi:hypothetical protein